MPGFSDEALDRLLAEMVAQQTRKVVNLARELVPNLTGDDILNPQDFPKLAVDPDFNFEDGLLAGLKAAASAIRFARADASGT